MSFVRACSVAELDPNAPLGIEIGDVPVAIVSTDEGLFAIYDECSHGRVLLSEGEVEDCTIECYAHGSRFDLRTGVPLELPATHPVPVYPVTIEGDDVLVDLDNPIKIQEP